MININPVFLMPAYARPPRHVIVINVIAGCAAAYFIGGYDEETEKKRIRERVFKSLERRRRYEKEIGKVDMGAVFKKYYDEVCERSRYEKEALHPSAK